MRRDISKLSEGQKLLLRKVITDKKNVFFTGCAGTGKSFVLQYIIDELRERHSEPSTVAVTASTGKAAFNIGGSTLHSFAGIGLGRGSKEELCNNASFNRNAADRWRKVKTLIIDEISMIDGELFDKLEYVARQVRKNSKRFGDIQLILVGDLLQLPPVNEYGTVKKRIFEAESWKGCIDEYVLLTRVFRQEDIHFLRVLSCIRVGAITQEVVEYMTKLEQKKKLDEDSAPVNLFAIRSKADEYNKHELDKIEGEIKTYLAKDTYTKSGKNKTYLLDSCQAPAKLELKVGAQVMLVKNINKDLVNGTVGIVTGFTNKIEGKEVGTNSDFSTESLPIVLFNLANGKTFTRPMKRELWESLSSTGQLQASRRQVPLILAWAITIHKSQGQTIQRLRVDLSDIFESGQLYTALSRAISPDTLEVAGFDPDRVTVDDISLQFCMNNGLI